MFYSYFSWNRNWIHSNFSVSLTKTKTSPCRIHNVPLQEKEGPTFGAPKIGGKNYDNFPFKVVLLIAQLLKKTESCELRSQSIFDGLQLRLGLQLLKKRRLSTITFFFKHHSFITRKMSCTYKYWFLNSLLSMWELSKRISLRTSSVLYEVEPERDLYTGSGSATLILTRVSQFRFKTNFASKRKLAIQKQFRFSFAKPQKKFLLCKFALFCC